MISERQVEAAWAAFRADQRGGKDALRAALEAAYRETERPVINPPRRGEAIWPSQ